MVVWFNYSLACGKSFRSSNCQKSFPASILTLHREMAVGNTFGATALSSYGGFWLSLAIVLTPGGFDIVASYKTSTANVNDFNNAFGYFLMGWWIFTTLLLLCTLRSTLAFFLLFFTLDLAFLFLACGHLTASAAGVANASLLKAGGYFGIFAAFLAWYNALAGIADDR
jgi:succinate-acetate transporter protein